MIVRVLVSVRHPAGIKYFESLLLRKLVEGEHEKLHIVHAVDAEGLADGIYLDCELLLDWLVLRLEEGLVVDQERALSDQKLKHVLYLIYRNFVVIVRLSTALVCCSTLGSSNH